MIHLQSLYLDMFVIPYLKLFKGHTYLNTRFLYILPTSRIGRWKYVIRDYTGSVVYSN